MNTVQWGSLVFSPDNEEEPQRATKPSAGELLHQIAVPDARTGHYRFGEEAIEYLEEYLGVFPGHMSGSLPRLEIMEE